MQMNDTRRIPASKDKVWAALNDPQVLKQCIPYAGTKFLLDKTKGFPRAKIAVEE